MAGNLYVQLCSEGSWIGVDQNKAIFPALKSPKAASAFLSSVKCHNCGGPHYLRECTEPKDQARIDANAKKMEEAKKLAKKDKQKGKASKTTKGYPPGGKFPERPKRGQPHKCTVDGKEYYFHFKNQRWLLVDHQANSASAPVVMTAATLAPGRTRNNSNTDASLAFSIFANQFTDAVAALESSVLTG
jgi:hypothetical protein